ncbi:hypothetical protein V8D89_005368 [Ganoderma adspersum]
MAHILSHPDSYSAYAFTEQGGSLHKITVPWKDPQAGQVVVKVLADEQVPKAIFPIQYPRIPGHEIVGDRVGAGWHGGHCHTCSRCRLGDFMSWEQRCINGILVDGGYAEFVTLRSEAIVAVPEDMDPVQVAPLLCAGASCFDALRSMNARAPDLVAVQGIGGLGHLALQIARAMGFRVVALSSGSAKESLARDLGAHHYLDSSQVDQAGALQSLGGAKVIMCTAPNSEAAQKLIPGLGVNGTLLILILETDPIAVSPIYMLGRRISITGWGVGHAGNSEEFIAFARTHDIKCLVERFPLEQAQEAFDRRSSARFRAVLVPGL